MTEPPLGTPPDAAVVFEVLDKHRVDYVLVGGFAAVLYGATRLTFDVDLTPSTERANLARLTEALRDLEARLRVAGIPEGLAFNTSAEALVGVRVLNLVTRAGVVDLTFESDGTGGYAELVDRAERRQVGRVMVRVAALDDVVHSKAAAARPKDLEALPELRQILAHQSPGKPDDPADAN